MPKMEPGEGEVALTLGLQHLQSDPREEPSIKRERPDLGDNAVAIAGDSELNRASPSDPPEISMEVGQLEDLHAQTLRRPRRDHRRNYQERWRSEFLMDYDRWRHGLVCMVCGATLATLKLSTIKRHILQRHQASLLLTRAEKEVVIASWEKHVLQQSYLQETMPIPVFGLEPMQPDLAPAGPSPPPEATPPPAAPLAAGRGRPPGKKPKAKAKTRTPTPPPPGLPHGLGRPKCRRVKRYYQERWRSEYLMDYDCLRNGLACMVCGSSLATLKLSTIKRHILQKHQASFSLTASQKDVVMATWVEHLLNQSQNNIESQGAGLAIVRQSRHEAPHFGQSQVEGRGAGLIGLHQPPHYEAAGPSPHCGQSQSQEAFPLSRNQLHIELPGLMDQSHAEIHDVRLSPPVEETPSQSRGRFQREEAGPIHSQLRLGESRVGPVCLINQSDIGIEERAGTMALFNQSHFNQSEAEISELGVEPSPTFLQSHGDMHGANSSQILSHSQMFVDPRGAGPAPPAVTPDPPASIALGPTVKAEEDYPTALTLQLPATSPEPSPGTGPPTPRRGGNSVRRYYQERWRSEHLMDYDRRRHGLVCMVCGKALATLTLSTIKRHILQNHPHSLDFNQAERENILEAWSEQARTGQSVLLDPLPRRSACQTQRYQERWRSDFLMDYDPWRHRLGCMVCGKSLATVALSTVKRHVLHNHPHSLHFSPAARENILEAWSKTVPWHCPDSVAPARREAPGSPDAVTGETVEEETQGDGTGSPVEIEVYVEEPDRSPAARRRLSGKDHRRNYQERWRLEFLMDYDRWRHGLVCMVCGATLATLKLSTIKRHILQRHQASLGYTLTQKVLLAQEWDNKMAAIAKMDLWRLPGSQSEGSPPLDLGGLCAGGT